MVLFQALIKQFVGFVNQENTKYPEQRASGAKLVKFRYQLQHTALEVVHIVKVGKQTRVGLCNITPSSL